MIRVEVKSVHKCFIICEDTVEAANAELNAMYEAGAALIEAHLYDRDKRVHAIRTCKTVDDLKTTDGGYIASRVFTEETA